MSLVKFQKKMGKASLKRRDRVLNPGPPRENFARFPIVVPSTVDPMWGVALKGYERRIDDAWVSAKAFLEAKDAGALAKTCGDIQELERSMKELEGVL